MGVSEELQSGLENTTERKTLGGEFLYQLLTARIRGRSGVLAYLEDSRFGVLIRDSEHDDGSSIVAEAVKRNEVSTRAYHQTPTGRALSAREVRAKKD
jgi:hypothetical protein